MEIMSIIKYGGKYMIYFPYIDVPSLKNKVCNWWGTYDTFDECFELMNHKNEYDHLIIDKKLLRLLKLEKINNEIFNNKENRT